MIRTFLFALLALSLQANAAVVGFNPASRTVNVNDVFSVGVEGSGFTANLDGGGFNLRFDPAVLEVLAVIIDPLVWDLYFPGDEGVIDNVAGTVSNTRFTQLSHPMVGAFPIIEYQFQAKALGSSLLRLTGSTDRFGSGGNVVPVTFTNGSVSVNAVPEPSTVSMLLAGLIFALGMSRRLRPQR